MECPELPPGPSRVPLLLRQLPLPLPLLLLLLLLLLPPLLPERQRQSGVAL